MMELKEKIKMLELKFCNWLEIAELLDISYDEVRAISENEDYVCSDCGFEFTDGRKISEGEHICLDDETK